MFSNLRLDELGALDSDIEEFLSEEALVKAKNADCDSAPHSDSTVIPFTQVLKSDDLTDVIDQIIQELHRLLPDVDSPITLSGRAIYLRGAHMGWHSNHSRSDGRIYCSWSEQPDTNYFRYQDPLSGELVTLWERPGWNVKSFTIPPDSSRFWHCIGANSLRVSLGFRYNLPGAD